jgi:hypothetical protein
MALLRGFPADHQAQIAGSLLARHCLTPYRTGLEFVWFGCAHFETPTTIRMSHYTSIADPTRITKICRDR